MKTSHAYRRIAVVALCAICLCTGCTKQKKDQDSPNRTVEDHNFSQSTLEVYYDSNYDAIGGEGFLFSIDEQTQEAELISYYDVALIEVTLPDTIRYEEKEYPVTSIGESAFESDQSIEKLQLGQNIRTIQPSAFYAAAALKEVVFQDTLEAIGEQAFAGCSALQDITWGSSLSTVGNAAFEGDEEIRTLQLPKSVTTWGSEVFMDCTGLTECVLEDGMETIGEGMFTNCTALQKITIPDSVTMIGAEAFWSCSELRELTLPDHVKTIGDQAFYSTGIQTLRLPEQLSSVKVELLDGMDQLTGITVPAVRQKDYESTFRNYGIEITSYE